MSRSVDVLIVGTGPAGASYARLVGERCPSASILIVDAGPELSEPPGCHLRSMGPELREAAQLESQGPERGVLRSSSAEYVPFKEGEAGVRPGLYPLGGGCMPAPALACCVGGMGIYWGGLTPRPTGSERSSLLADAEWKDAIEKAEAFLSVSNQVPPQSSSEARIADRVAELCVSILGTGHLVSRHPMAARPKQGGRDYSTTAPADILAPIVEPTKGGSFGMQAETLARSLVVSGDRVSGVELEHRGSKETEEVQARAVVVAADVFHTPQLLWASGIRPEALGRYLMDHPLSRAAVELDVTLTESVTQADETALQVPFGEGQHPFHGIVLLGEPNLVPGMSTQVDEGVGTSPSQATLVWLGRTFPRPSNRVLFSDERTDWMGMPAIAVEFELDEREEEERQRGCGLVERFADGLGSYVPGWEASMRPLGTSLHCTGTVRMGENDDGTSVCDSRSRVWGFENLFLAGNGVIPTATTVNPTLTSVALAVHSAAALTELLEASS